MGSRTLRRRDSSRKRFRSLATSGSERDATTAPYSCSSSLKRSVSTTRRGYRRATAILWELGGTAARGWTAALVALAVTALEALDAATGVNELLFAGVKGVTLVAE